LACDRIIIALLSRSMAIVLDGSAPSVVNGSLGPRLERRILTLDMATGNDTSELGTADPRAVFAWSTNGL
jgi:hypothetical protein